MGISTDLMQQLNRGFVSERAKKKAEKEARERRKQLQNDFKNFLYKKFYAQFYVNKKNNPDNIFAKFQDVDEMRKIVNNDNYTTLEIFYRIETYNSVLKKVYNQFKNDFKLNYSYENIEKEEAKQQKELEKLRKEHIKLLNEREKLLNERQKIKNRGVAKIAGALFVGGRIASKTYKKMKY